MHLLERFDLFHFDYTFFETIGHVIDQTVEETLEPRSLYLQTNLLSVVFDGPESLEQLGAIVSVMKLGEKHALASELNVYIELNNCFHEIFVDKIRSGEVRSKFLLLVRIYKIGH